MKKITTILMIVLLSLSLTACNKSNRTEISDILRGLQTYNNTTSVMIDDFTEAWIYGIDNEYISIDILSSITSFESSELTNSNCEFFAGLYEVWEYATKCVVGSYQDVGEFEAVRNGISGLTDRIETIKEQREYEENYIEKLEEIVRLLTLYIELAENYEGTYADYTEYVADLEYQLSEVFEWFEWNELYGV